MFVRSEESSQPSIVVAEGETFTLSAQHSREYPNLITNLRPRTTAALLVAAGRPPVTPLRLSDTGAFEHVEKTEGLINLHARDDEGRVGGYSVPFLSRIFDALDPAERTPSRTVQMRTKIDSNDVHPCGFQEHDSQPVTAAVVQDNQARIRDYRNLVVAPVPDFLIDFKVHFLAHLISDIIVGPKATLVLDDTVAFMVVRNLLCYQGSRIIQKSSHMNIDITGTFRGGIPSYLRFYATAEVLKIRMQELQRVSPDKP